MKVFVTTAPRKVPTLKTTLKSLWDAGFRDLSVRRGVGAFANWFGCLNEGAAMGEQFAIAQDDILVARGLARIAEYQVAGVVSHYRCPKPGWGACFYVFSPDAADKLCQQDWKSDRNIDGFVYQSCRNLGIPFWQPDDSYVLHIGETSTLGDDLKCAGWRQAMNFRDEV